MKRFEQKMEPGIVGRWRLLVRSRLPLLLLLSLPFLVLGPGRPAGAKTITDIRGRKVEVPEKVARLAAIGPGALRLVTYLGAVEQVCGVEKRELMLAHGLLRPYAMAIRNKIADLPLIGMGGSRKMPNLERLLALNPDLLVGVGFSGQEIALITGKLDKPLLVLSYGGLPELNESFLTSLEILGRALQRQARARELIRYIRGLQKDLKRRTREVSSPRRVYIGGIAYKGANELTSTTSAYYPFRLLPVTDLAGRTGMRGHIFIDWEKLILWDPEYIFIDRISLKRIRLSRRRHPERFEMLTACRRGRIFAVLPYNYYNINVELAFINAYFIGKTLYPQNFADLDFARRAREIYRMFLNTEPPGELIGQYLKLDFGCTGN